MGEGAKRTRGLRGEGEFRDSGISQIGKIASVNCRSWERFCSNRSNDEQFSGLIFDGTGLQKRRQAAANNDFVRNPLIRIDIEGGHCP